MPGPLSDLAGSGTSSTGATGRSVVAGLCRGSTCRVGTTRACLDDPVADAPRASASERRANAGGILRLLLSIKPVVGAASECVARHLLGALGAADVVGPPLESGAHRRPAMTRGRLMSVWARAARPAPVGHCITSGHGGLVRVAERSWLCAPDRRVSGGVGAVDLGPHAICDRVTGILVEGARRRA